MLCLTSKHCWVKEALTFCQENVPKNTVAQKRQSQISLLKHKTVSQNTNQFPKAQISFPKHKSISQNTNKFLKTRTSLPKHKPISRNTNQFRETQINGLGTFSVIIRESLERTHSQDFPRPTWRHLHVSDNSSSLR